MRRPLSAEVPPGGLDLEDILRSYEYLKLEEIVVAVSFADFLKRPKLDLSGQELEEGVFEYFLTPLKWIEVIELGEASYPKKALAKLKRLPLLADLNFKGSASLDYADIKVLSTFPALTHLDLTKTGVKDAAVPHLIGMKSLRRVNLTDTKISLAGLIRLRKARPRLIIDYFSNLQKRKAHEKKQLKALSLNTMEQVRAAVKYLKPFDLGLGLEFIIEMDSLDLQLTGENVAGIEALRALPALTFLDLGNSTVRGKQLQGLRQLTSLRGLSLNHTPIDGSELSYLKEHRGLTNLSLGNTKFRSKGLSLLSRMTWLTKLGLGVTKVNDDDLRQLGNLKRMRQLNLAFAPLSGKGLRYLRGMGKLTHLNLGWSRVQDKELVNLKYLPSLIDLILTYTDFSDAGLVHLKNLKSLMVLNLRKAEVQGEGLRHLSTLKELRTVFLGFGSLTDSGAFHLKHLKSVRRLYLNRQSALKDKHLKALGELTNLEFLDLSNNVNITGSGLRDLAGLSGLKELHLSETSVPGKYLSALPPLKKLKTLILDKLKIGDKDLAPLGKLKNLEILQLDGTQVTKAGAAKLKKSFPEDSDLIIIISE